VIRTTIARVLRKGIKVHSPGILNQEKLRILDAGCGTGETTAGIAKLFPNAEVFGIDVNPTSLKLAEKFSKSKGLNLKFFHCNINDDLEDVLASYGIFDKNNKFDIITSIGVLHHLEEPETGFSNLRSLINNQGLFLVFMYSRFGRWGDIAVQELIDKIYDRAEFDFRGNIIHLLSLSSRHTFYRFIRGLKNRYLYGLPIRPIELTNVFLKRNRKIHLSDTFSNPCEHFFNFSQLEQIANETNWEMLGLAKKGGLPTTPEEYSKDTRKLKILNLIPRSDLYDIFAFSFEALGFLYWLRPNNKNSNY